MRYAVVHWTLCDGWVNCWTEEDPDGTTRPVTYATEAEAQAELDELLTDADAEGLEEDPDAYRVVELPDEATP